MEDIKYDRKLFKKKSSLNKNELVTNWIKVDIN